MKTEPDCMDANSNGTAVRDQAIVSDRQFTDCGAEADEDDTMECAYCGRYFDDNREGHIDEATDLAFCDAPCEMHYAQETGLPDDYELSCH